jgi:hypothetical protein
MHNFSVCCVVILLWLCTSCTEEVPVFLSNEQIAVLDSMLTVTIPKAREQEDSMCKVHFHSRLHHLVDSLLIARREEEARLRQIVPSQ